MRVEGIDGRLLGQRVQLYPNGWANNDDMNICIPASDDAPPELIWECDLINTACIGLRPSERINVARAMGFEPLT